MAKIHNSAQVIRQTVLPTFYLNHKKRKPVSLDFPGLVNCI